jgi:trehalose 6-phosphate phosphatase
MTPVAAQIENASYDPLQRAWEQVREAHATYGHVFLFTDFDGTLSEMTTIPSAATIESRTKTILRNLCCQRSVTVAVLSGRALTDVAERVGLPAIYGGDHGLEIRGPGFDYVAPGAESARLRLPELCNCIRTATRAIPGALVECKRYSASVHFRQVPPHQADDLMNIVHQCVDGSLFEVRMGQCVMEIRPRIDWDKGAAADWLVRKQRGLARQAICLGDDETDEDMFRRMPGAVTVRVTQSKDVISAATYRVERRSVDNLLEGLLDTIHGLTL